MKLEPKETGESLPGVSFLVDDKKHINHVMFDMSIHSELIEDILDIIAAESRKNEPKTSLEMIKKRIGLKG